MVSEVRWCMVCEYMCAIGKNTVGWVDCVVDL